jgi:WD40 repeat protein
MASHDRTVRIWDSRTGKPLLDPIKLPEKDSSACFALDETFFVTESVGGGTGNGEVQLWDTETGRELCEPIVRDMDQDVSVHSYTSSDGRRLFAGLSGGHKQLSYISFDIPPSDQPMPAWLADLAEALCGFRLTGDNTLELLRVDQQNSILHNVAGNVSADHTDEWSAVVRWLLDYGKDAVVSPSSTLTIWALVSRDSSPTTGAPVRMDLLVHSPLNPKSPNPPV